MDYKKFQGIFYPTLIIIIAVIIRLLPHPPNFVPIGAMALFGGAYLDKKYAFIIPLLAMFISDLFLGLHSTMIFVYASFILIGIMGIWLKTHLNIKSLIGASLTSSVLFFIITNFGVWFMFDFYTKNLAGLLDSYIAAIPFFRNTLISDLVYIGLFFGSFELVKRYLFVRKNLPQN